MAPTTVPPGGRPEPLAAPDQDKTLQVAVVADDLTGAADSGVQFRQVFESVFLLPYRRLADGRTPAGAAAISVYTDSRALPRPEARARLAALAAQLKPLKPGWTYKKVDSCLRGNIGVEAEALMEVMGFEQSFIAPALPAQGRATRGGLHLVHGVPVAETEMARDPVTPVRESSLERIIAGQTRLGVAHVGLEAVRAGQEALTAEAARLRDGGARQLTFDAVTQADLTAIVDLALSRPGRTLLVGSAGLAESLGQRLGRGRAVTAPAAGLRLKLDRRHLLVCGTASARTLSQIDRLASARGHSVHTLKAALLADPAREAERRERARLIAAGLAERDAVIRIAQPDEADPPGRAWPARDVVAGLGGLAARVVAAADPASLFLSGGDTATAVLESLGALGLNLESEVRPGLVVGSVLGGVWPGRPAACKPGAFGDDDYLISLDDYWLKLQGERPDESC